MAAPRPRPATPPGLLDEDEPSKWEQTKQVLWESNLNAPIRGFYNLMNTPYDVLMGADGPEKEQAVADSFDAAGGITVGSMPMPKPSNALTMGIRAYHGSPHSFDKFDMSKIGTGEGAQAYGHGLYFAENEGVAQGYKNALAPGMGDGALRAAGVSDAELRSMRQFTQSAVDPDIALRDWLSWNKKTETPEIRAAFMQEWNAKNPGSMYEVEINADPNADFINYDAPWSEQPQKVRDAFHYLSKNQPDGSDLARRIEAPVFAQEASDRGVKGIQFLDAGSRGAGDGTRNYVVFDDSLIDIIKKYGIAGLLGAGGMYGMSDDQAQAGAF